jgi:hypothetical protein
MLHAAITSFIGMNVGKRILRAWEHIAPAGGCAAHIVTLIAAVEHISLFAPGDSADRSDQPNALAALLTRSGDITRIVHVWGGDSPPNDSTVEFDRLGRRNESLSWMCFAMILSSLDVVCP